MSTLVIDRSTSATSVVLNNDDGTEEDFELGIWSGTPASHPLPRLERIIVGTGPGSFAGIRSALAFAQGYAVGANGAVRVVGLTSAAAFAEGGRLKAVVGDGRRGKFWIALFDGFTLLRDIFQVEQDGLAAAVPPEAAVVSPDFSRIGAVLAEVFGARAAVAPRVDARALYRAAAANPALLQEEPLPIYLNPAVRA